MPTTTYCADADILLDPQILAELTTSSGATPDATALDRFRVTAFGIINGFLGGRYKVPVPTSATVTREILKAHEAIIARHLALEYRLNGGAGEESSKAYEATLSFLKGIRDERGNLPDAPPPDARDLPAALVGSFGSDTPVFTSEMYGL